eukprot:1730121-Pyramimonas_sp.AAC.1
MGALNPRESDKMGINKGSMVRFTASVSSPKPRAPAPIRMLVGDCRANQGFDTARDTQRRPIRAKIRHGIPS